MPSSKQVLSALGLASLPLLLTLLLIVLFVGEDPRVSIPYFTDEVYYWLQIDGVRAAGFNTGYYTFDELTAPAAFSRFGAHGPAFVVLYGLPARLTGLTALTLPLYNALIVTGALFAVTLAMRRDRQQTVWLALWLATLWPLLLFLPRWMQEALHFALAFGFAYGFYRIHTQPVTRRDVALLAVLILAASTVRFTWALLLPPLLLHAAPPTRTQRLLALCASVVLVGASFALFTWWAAPFSVSAARDIAAALAGSVLEALALWRAHLERNFFAFFFGNLLEVLVRFQLITIVLMSAGTLRKPAPRHTAQPRLPRAPAHLLVYLLCAMLLLQVVVYDIGGWRDFRNLSVFVAFAGMLLVLHRQFRMVRYIVITNLVLLPVFLFTFNLYYGTDHKRQDFAPALAAFSSATAPHLRYDASAANPWCNTVLGWNFVSPLLRLPAGMGYSVGLKPEDFRAPPRARYLLYRPDEISAFGVPLNLELLATTPAGHLYYNRDSACPASP